MVGANGSASLYSCQSLRNALTQWHDNELTVKQCSAYYTSTLELRIGKVSMLIQTDSFMICQACPWHALGRPSAGCAEHIETSVYKHTSTVCWYHMWPCVSGSMLPFSVWMLWIMFTIVQHSIQLHIYPWSCPTVNVCWGCCVNNRKTRFDMTTFTFIMNNWYLCSLLDVTVFMSIEHWTRHPQLRTLQMDCHVEVLDLVLHHALL